jgi:hypothetical protein
VIQIIGIGDARHFPHARVAGYAGRRAMKIDAMDRISEGK